MYNIEEFIITNEALMEIVMNTSLDKNLLEEISNV
jgi:hypothetical protein